MLSTELKDCTDDLEGLAAIELDNLREWEEKFNFKVGDGEECVKAAAAASWLADWLAD